MPIQIKASNLTINVSKLESSIEFYQNLGFVLEQRWGEHYAQLSAPGIILGLHPSAKARKVQATSISIGFTVKDFSLVREELNKLAIVYKERVEQGGQFLHFNDPDGTPLYFIQPNN